MSTDQAAIESIYRQLINAWNEMNAEGFAALFAENANMIGFDGSMANSRREILEQLSAIFGDHQPAKFITIIREIRFLSPSVGLLRAAVGMVTRGQKEINPKTN